MITYNPHKMSFLASLDIDLQNKVIAVEQQSLQELVAAAEKVKTGL